MSEAESAWKVAFTRHAESDILTIFAFIAEQEGPDRAEAVSQQFIEARDSLRELPERGRVPPELERVSIRSFREIQVKPYRVIYQVNQATREIYIHVVADGRRNCAELLQERLLGPMPQPRKRQ